jgi:PAS domain S-box-containing protein
MFEAAGDGILLLNAESTQIEDVNPFLVHMLGYSYDEFLGKKIWEIGAFANAALSTEAFVELKHNGYIRFEDLPLISKDGTQHSVEFVCNVYDCAGVDVIQCNIRDNAKRHLTEIALRATTRALKMLSEGNQALLGSETETILLKEYCRIAVETGGYSMAWIGLADEGPEMNVHIISQFGQKNEWPNPGGVIWSDTDDGHSLFGNALRSGKVQFTEHIEDDARMLPLRSWALACGFHSIIAVPFLLPGRQRACLCLSTPKKLNWSAPEAKLLQEMADDLTFGVRALRTTIDNIRHETRLRESLEQTIQVISATSEERDSYTAGHQRRVAAICSKISAKLGLPEERIHGLNLAATIHDLGKIGIPSEILSKPRRLTTTELNMVREHSTIGFNILKDVNFPWPIARMVLEHHERVDGSGYPNGLKGYEILLESKILAVADVVEAIASHRPYRAALGIEVALCEITEQRGITLEADVVDACLYIFREEGYRIED